MQPLSGLNQFSHGYVFNPSPPEKRPENKLCLLCNEPIEPLGSRNQKRHYPNCARKAENIKKRDRRNATGQ